MKRIITISITLLLLAMSGCSTQVSLDVRNELSSLPQWDEIRKFAQKEIRRIEGTIGWDFVLSKDYSLSLYPINKEEDIWTVVAAADYPNNTLGEIVDMKIKEDGTVIFYKNRLKSKNDKAESDSLCQSLRD